MAGVVWLLDNYSEDVITGLEAKGYVVRRFFAQNHVPMQFDERPDMIFFSRLTAETAAFLTKIYQFFPGVLAMSVPSLLPAEEK
jgi:hypothetical protein